MQRNQIVRSKRILLVDDDQMVRDSIAMLLRLDEHVVTRAASAEEALALFASSIFDLVITDFAMAKMNGRQFAAAIKGLSPTQPVLMVTAFSPDADGVAEPVDAVLHKPFPFDDLRQAVARLCVALPG